MLFTISCHHKWQQFILNIGVGAMTIEIRMGEEVIKKGPANHFKGMESVGGRLYLTNQRVYFKSHPINVQTHELTIELKDIKTIGKRNTLGIVPNGVFIETQQGNTEKLVVNGRKKWLFEITKLLETL